MSRIYSSTPAITSGTMCAARDAADSRRCTALTPAAEMRQ
jgi:hypothetical protein